MALVLKDRVKETSTTTGTGTFTLAGASTGFQSFSVIGNANTVYYAIVLNGANEWEIGLGTYTSSGTTLSRDTVLESSNSGSKVSFSSGTKEVFCTYPAEKAVTLDDVQTLSNKTLASPSVTGQITFSDASTQNTAAAGFGMKNRLINGAMVISQRNNGASITPNNSYTLDRWLGYNSQTSKFTVQQNAASVTPPTGFSNYLGITSSSAYSVAAGDYFGVSQTIEGFNTSDLAWGTAAAQSITLSFWVRSSLTGTFSVSIRNYGSYNRGYPATYTINAANTWEQKTITIAGDTTGTWTGSTNSGSLLVSWGVGTGSTYSGTANAWQAGNIIAATGATSVVGTNGATFYITGVQLEKGSTATSFDYRPYGTELQLCQRYYYKQSSDATAVYYIFGNGFAASTTSVNITVPLKVTMRATPTSIDSASVVIQDYNSAAISISALTINAVGSGASSVLLNAACTGATQYKPYFFGANNTASGYIGLGAEL
jgi:hypothetical protein